MKSFLYQAAILIVLGSQFIQANVLVKQDLYQTGASFSSTNWKFSNDDSDFNRITSDCETIYLEIQNGESIKKQFVFPYVDYQNIRIEMNLYFIDMVDSQVIIGLNGAQIYSNIFLAADYAIQSTLCSSLAYQYLLSQTYNLLIKPSDHTYDISISYTQSIATTSATLGIRDLLIFVDSLVGTNGCPLEYPLMSIVGECTQYCGSKDYLIGPMLDQCINYGGSRQRKFPLSLIPPETATQNPNYPSSIKQLNIFDESHSSASSTIFDWSTTLMAQEHIQVQGQIYLIGTWNSGSYLEIKLAASSQTLFLFKVEFDGSIFKASNGAQIYEVALILVDGTTIYAKMVQMLVQGSISIGTHNIRWYQNLIGSIIKLKQFIHTATYALSNFYHYRSSIGFVCSQYVLDNYCISCNSTFYAYLGGCVSKCPTHSILSISNKNCTDYKDSETVSMFPLLTKNGIGTYLLKAFNDLTFDDTSIESIFPSNPCITDNCLNSQRYSLIPGQKMFGGYNSWGKGSYSKSWSGLETHYQIRIYFKLYFIDSWTKSDKFTVSIDGGTQYFQESISSLIDTQIGGMSIVDFEKDIFYRVPHSSNSLSIEFLCLSSSFGDSSMSSCGMTDLYILIDNDILPLCPSITEYYSYYTNNCRTCDSSCIYGCVLFETNCICHYSCQTCNGSGPNQCLTCDNNKHRVDGGSNTCICDSASNYDENGQNCVLSAGCHYSCDQCFASGDRQSCATCPDYTLTHRQRGPNTDCPCQTGFYESGSQICQLQNQCHHSCQTCSADNSATNCLTCPQPGNHRATGAATVCPCDIDYEDVGYPLCTKVKCHYSCGTCSVSNSTADCLTCPTTGHNRTTGSASSCPCNPGYEDIGSVTCQLISPCDISCQLCSVIDSSTDCVTCPLISNRVILSNTCQCDAGYQEDSPIQQNCIPICHYSCLTCSLPNSSTSCDTCYDNVTSHRTKTGNICLCDTDYIDDGLNQNCTFVCDPTCLTCTAPGSNICLSCDDTLNRIDGGNNDCICKEGYQENLGSCYLITPCHVSCLLCSIVSSQNNCVSCHKQNHRTLNTLYQCLCDIGYEDSTDPMVGECLEVQCHYSCLTCSASNSSTQCLLCPNPLISHRVSGIDNDCLCEINYTEQPNEANCSPICHQTCLTCLLPLLGDSCLTCNESDTHRILNQNNECVCDPRYSEIADQLICAPICHQNCSTCYGIYENQCLTCNESYHRYLNNGYCECQQFYWDVDGQTECICIEFINLACDLQNGWLSTKCIKIDCNDGHYTYGEDCDDGNSDSRDGCLDCKLQKGFFCESTPLQQTVCIKCGLNCEECNKNGQCKACQLGYEINSLGLCVSCPDNCESCKNHKCEKCIITPNITFTNQSKDCPICENQLGAYSNALNANECRAICGDLITLEGFEECDDGNTLDSDGCSSTCKIEKGFFCKESLCMPPKPAPQPFLTRVIPTDNYTDLRIYYLNYSTFILNDSKMIDRISIQIENKTKDIDYMINITENILEQDSEGYYNYSQIIALMLLKSFEAKLIEVQFTDINSIVGINGVVQEISGIYEPIYDYFFKSETLIKSTKNVNSLNEITLYILLGMVGLGVLIGGIDTFWNLLDLVQLLSYINFIDTRYPYNLSKFLEVFEFGQLKFLDNIIKIQTLLKEYIGSSELQFYQPKRIFSDQVDSSLFLINASSTITAFLIVTGLYILFSIIHNILHKLKISYSFLNQFNPRRLNKVQLTIQFWNKLYKIKNQIKKYTKKYCNSFFWNVIIRTHMSVTYDISFAIFLQFQYSYLDMKSLLPKISYCSSIFVLLAQGVAIYFYISKLNISKAQFKQKSFQNKYGEALFENLKLNNIGSIKTYYNVFLISKRILYMAVLIAVSEVPQLQTICLSLLGSIHIVFLLLKRPLDSTAEFVKQLQSEILMLLMHLQICLLTIDDSIHLFTEEGRMLIGWICVGEVSLIIAIQLIIDISQQMIYIYSEFKGIRNIIKFFRNKYPKKKNEIIQPQLFF